MRLTWLQQIHRRISLHFRGSYEHPDGTVELDIDTKAGIDPTTDSEEVQREKFYAWNRRTAERERWFQTFAAGAIVGAALMYWWFGS